MKGWREPPFFMSTAVTLKKLEPLMACLSTGRAEATFDCSGVKHA
jgi:hypothetical protein